MEPIMPDSETITIPKSQYDELIMDQRKLDALERHGVDNWDWYGDAMAEIYGPDEDDED
jgi:hypothetical protein